jgi:hypothetical protein
MPSAAVTADGLLLLRLALTHPTPPTFAYEKKREINSSGSRNEVTIIGM